MKNNRIVAHKMPSAESSKHARHIAVRSTSNYTREQNGRPPGIHSEVFAWPPRSTHSRESAWPPGSTHSRILHLAARGTHSEIPARPKSVRRSMNTRDMQKCLFPKPLSTLQESPPFPRPITLFPKWLPCRPISVPQRANQPCSVS